MCEIRSFLLAQLTTKLSKPYKKVYVSRQKAQKRVVNNAKEVAFLLEKYGFETYYLEEHTLNEQIKLMSETKVLIGVHGAGLTNMLFMPAGGFVIELRNAQDRHNLCFFALACALGHNYYYLNNEGEGTRYQEANLSINTNLLANLLESLTKNL